MTDTDKPFVCPVANCGSRFANEDHLSVHKTKHEMSLRLKDNQSVVKTNFVDETPTPTRFLQNCEEVGLFAENPFDEQFRQASRQSILPGSLSVDETLGTLNTPNIPHEVSSSEEILPSTTELDVPSFIVRSSSKSVSEDAGDSMPFNPNLPTSLIEDDADHTLNTPAAPEPPFLHHMPNTKVITLPTPTTTVIQMPVIKTVKSEITNSSSSSLPAVRSTTLAAPARTIMQTPVPSVPTAVKTDPVTANVEKSATQMAILLPTSNLVAAPQTYQLILKLPDGQIPINAAAAPTLCAPLVIPKNGLQAQPSVKMKLKQSILQTASTTHKEVEVIKSTRAEVTAPVPTPLPAADSTTPAKGPGSRRGQRGHENDPEEKRKKLERNCAAAKRCRQRKKAFVQSLKQKTEKLEEQNAELKSEVSMLRIQLAELRAHLLLHKDCPVTVQQQAAGQPNVSNLDVLSEVPRESVPSNNITIFSALNATAPSSTHSLSAEDSQHMHPLSVQVDLVTSESSNEVDTESNHSASVSG